ncbi:MAG: peptidoglycan-associated lipoprotein Pal [Desulfobacteraceae bacterium]|jgi:peptidoglycan-associated lipoprotein|nr:MAG: peptidoglycan-associated lipoprotein Pal [Desulfobacteraceae bacterium]
MFAFLGLFLFLGASCAKKQVQVTEPPKAAPEVKPEQAPAPKAEGEDAAAKEARLRAEKEQQLEKQRKAFESENIYFDFDKYEIKPEAKTVLQKKAEWLLANTRYSVRIEGHCDERGTNEYNLALGERRANAAKEFLTALGVPGARISIISYGEERPAVQGANEEAWAKNRRDEFKLIY